MLKKMNTTKITVLTSILIIIAACSASKKSATSTADPAPASTVSKTAPTSNYFYIKADGIQVPGEKELTVIQRKYKDITLEQLKEGHTIYTGSACIRCHDAKNIYELEEAKWKDIMDDMAQKADISDSQKDAVYKYVLAMKATQPNE
jgi:hypothetical protein